jgi:hypothetical protein
MRLVRRFELRWAGAGKHQVREGFAFSKLGREPRRAQALYGILKLTKSHPYKPRVGHPQVRVIVLARNALVGNASSSGRDWVASWKNPPLKSRGEIPEEAIRRGTIRSKSALTFALVPEHVLGGWLCRSYEKIR